MKVIKNNALIWICPHHSVCKGKFAHTEGECLHSASHEVISVCEVTVCKGKVNSMCHWEVVDETNT